MKRFFLLGCFLFLPSILFAQQPPPLTPQEQLDRARL